MTCATTTIGGLGACASGPCSRRSCRTESSCKASSQQSVADHLAHNLLRNGSSVDFRERNALHYHVYDLKAYTEMAAQMPRGFFSDADAAEIEKGIAFLEPFFTGRRQHIEFAGSRVPFDTKRRQAQDRRIPERAVEAGACPQPAAPGPSRLPRHQGVVAERRRRDLRPDAQARGAALAAIERPALTAAVFLSHNRIRPSRGSGSGSRLCSTILRFAALSILAAITAGCEPADLMDIRRGDTFKYSVPVVNPPNSGANINAMWVSYATPPFFVFHATSSIVGPTSIPAGKRGMRSACSIHRPAPRWAANPWPT